MIGEAKHGVRSWKGSGGLRLAIALASVWVLYSSTGLGSAAASVTVAAPYKGTGFATANSYYPLLPGPCATANVTTPANWHPSTGWLGWRHSASMKGGAACTGSNVTYGATTASTYSQITVAVPIGSPSTTGTHSVVATWIFNLTAKWSTGHGPCPRVILTQGNGYQFCDVSAGFSLYMFTPFLVDLKSGSTFYSYTTRPYYSNSSSWTHDVDCYSNNPGSTTCTNTSTFSGAPSGKLSSSARDHIYWNSTSMNASHRYAIQFTVAGTVFASLYGQPQPWNATASSFLNVATKGNGIFLTSVVIT
jgi:hypothetical protein